LYREADEYVTITISGDNWLLPGGMPFTWVTAVQHAATDEC
jgi:hypothetical protein